MRQLAGVADLKFAFIEGTPPRDVENVTAFWKGIHYLNNWDETICPRSTRPVRTKKCGD